MIVADVCEGLRQDHPLVRIVDLNVPSRPIEPRAVQHQVERDPLGVQAHQDQRRYPPPAQICDLTC